MGCEMLFRGLTLNEGLRAGEGWRGGKCFVIILANVRIYTLLFQKSDRIDKEMSEVNTMH